MATTVLFALAGRLHPLAHAGAGADELLRARRSERRARDLADAQGARASTRRCSRRVLRRRVGHARRSAWCCWRSAARLLHPARRRVRAAARRGRPARRGAAAARHRADASRSRPTCASQRALCDDPRGRRTSSPRTGAPEVATDPMGIEQSDVYIDAASRATHGAAGSTKAALGEEIAEAIERAVPEVAGGVSQPIQMRTNELVAGVRSDVAVQIYGPDLDELAGARRAGRRGAAAASPARSTCASSRSPGSRYLRITPDRARLARYGLTIEDVNQRHRDDGGRAHRSARCSRGSGASAWSCSTAHRLRRGAWTSSARCRSSR